jgi:hypothetical protein
MKKHLTKKDIEGFLSSFIYNIYGATSVNTISSLVFTDENYVNKKLNHRTRANPPPPELNGDLQTQEINNDHIHNHRVKEIL